MTIIVLLSARTVCAAARGRYPECGGVPIRAGRDQQERVVTAWHHTWGPRAGLLQLACYCTAGGLEVCQGSATLCYFLQLFFCYFHVIFFFSITIFSACVIRYSL